MPYLEFDNVGFAALTCAVPENVQTLDENSAQAKSFQKYTGVKQRHISVTRQTNLDLGCAAAHKALQKADWPISSLDGLIYMSQTPDFNPGTGNAFLAHYILGLKEDCLAFDIPLACSSFPYGLSVCASLLQQKDINRILMISGDTQWHFYEGGVPVAYPDGRFMFGEASSALLLEKRADSPSIKIALYTNGAGYKYLFNPVAGCRNSWEGAGPFLLPNGDIHTLSGKFGYMDGIEITTFSTTKVVEDIRKFLEQTQKTINDFDGLVLHQANKQIVTTIARRLKADLKKVPLSLDRYGNTSGASVSVTIADAYSRPGGKTLDLLLSAFGTGLSWGIVSLAINPDVIEPIFTTSEHYFEEGFVKCPGSQNTK